MDTTTYLVKLLGKKTEPGGAPLVTEQDLDAIRNSLAVDQAELIFHIATSYNESHVVNYLLDRYNINPNKVIINSHPAYIYAMMFKCYDVIKIFLNRGILPDRWYLFFLFCQIHQEDDLIDFVISNFSKQIKLQKHEIDNLFTLVNHHGLHDFLEKQQH